MSKKITVYDLWSQKGKRKWAQTHIDTDKEAEAAFKAGIEIISCEPDHYFPIVREVASGAFLSVGLKHGTVSSKQEAIKKGFEISGLNEVKDSIIFHAGTSFNNGKIVTNGGRVLSIVSSGKTMKEALKKSYKSIDKINFEGKTYRQDIGFDL